MTFTKPLGAFLRQYRSDMHLVWSLADSWIEMWAERIDPTPPTPPVPPDNVVDMAERRLRAVGRL